MASTPNNPDMLILLGKLDGKLDGIGAQLQAIINRADQHDARLASLESTVATHDNRINRNETRIDGLEASETDHTNRLNVIETTAKNMRTMVVAAWAVFGTAVLAAAAKIVGLF